MDKETIKKAAETAAQYTKNQSLPAWVKYLVTALIGAAAAVASMTLTSCTVSPATAAQVQAVDALFHTAAPYIIKIDTSKK